MRPSSKTGFILTRLLVLLSFLGSLLTSLLAFTGFGEVYPFASWKLYTQPLGYKRHVEEYRIYTMPKGATQYVRQPVSPTVTFSQDEYVYTLTTLVQAALAEGQTSVKAKARLLSFAQHVAPAASHYKIVRESYTPNLHSIAPQRYDTLTVLTF
ncbi:hypothetical protein MKJ04_06885 [Pontibacter sp. E15-1]|uniref:hypothetical protein n=1 Tax=Pontibacter sp. E15-1 TaxID=2919918 RepID=UPI001F4FDD6C|nr:hypothetical protein [Pontibacter sp. E15-1]MCJ8164567.1 hypothetical protein [Pontibacter sp. E15-1]